MNLDFHQKNYIARHMNLIDSRYTCAKSLAIMMSA